MGKERLIESARQGLKSTKDFVTKPYVVPSSLGTALVLSVFGIEIVEENTADIVVSGISTVLNALGTLCLALGPKRNSPKTPH